MSTGRVPRTVAPPGTAANAGRVAGNNPNPQQGAGMQGPTGQTRLGRTATGNSVPNTNPSPQGQGVMGGHAGQRTTPGGSPAGVGGASRVPRPETGSFAPAQPSGQPNPANQPGVGGTRAQRSGTGTSVLGGGSPAGRTQRVPGSAPPGGPGAGAGVGPGPGSGGAINRGASRIPAGASQQPQQTTDLSAVAAMAPNRSSSRSSVASEPGGPATPRAVLRARRVSKIIVEKEKKTDYWQDVVSAAKAEVPDLTPDEINGIISRALSLELVGNWKQRESVTGPQPRDLFKEMELLMTEKLSSLAGKQVNVPGPSCVARIRAMEPVLTKLEAEKEKESEAEEEKVRSKVGELQTSLRVLQERKEADITNKRKTMSLELNNLREQMAKAAAEPSASPESGVLSDKMNRLEAALRLLNEERKKGVEDKDTMMLKKKLAIFEAKLAEVAEQKKLEAAADAGSQLQEKLLLMEEKLQKMERRKSVSITMMMQQKMVEVENQLQNLRVQGGGGGNNDSKIQMLESKLLELQNTKVTPAMVNDAETNALRGHISKLEEAMVLANRQMEDQRMKVEQERMMAWKKRQEEEEDYRKKSRMREEMLLQKMAEMEKRIAQGGGGRGAQAAGGGAIDAAMAKRLEDMEKRLQQSAGSPLQSKLEEMEKRLKDTEAALVKEKSTSELLFDALNKKEGPELEAASKDMQIAMLRQQTEALMKKFEDNEKRVTEQIANVVSRVETMKFTGGGGGPVQHQSGLTYAQINTKLEEIQAKLFDENTPEQEAEALNIEYEKLISELEGTPEYQKEQEAIAQKWKTDNEPLNNAALAQVRERLATMAPNERTTLLGRKPELKFLGFTQEQIMKKHVNDFKGVTTQNLDESEARALYHCMPPFRKDMEKQMEFVEQLKNKIEIEVKKPKKKPPPPIQAKKAVVFKKPPAGGGGGGASFLDELVKKRKVVN